jgi:hypothetical protein
MGKIEPTLLALAESVRSFKEDADLEVCLGKCTIYMPGIPKERAHQLIRDCIDADESGTLETLRPMLAHDLDVIQVQGLCVVGTPMGASQDVREYVRSKCGTICNDVEQMRVCSDPLIRYQLLKFCMNTRLSFPSRNVTPDNMASCCDPLDRAHIGPAHVDQKIVHEVLRAATSDTIRVSDPKYGWCTLKVQSPHHEGGYAITPTAASGLAAFYSATSKLVALLASLPHRDAWVRGGQALAAHDTWSNTQLMALVQTHTCLIHDYKCAEQQPQHDAPAAPAAAAQVPQAPTPLLIPPLNQLALLLAARAPGENAENAQDEVAQGPRMPEQRKITAAIMKEWGPHKALRALGAPHHRGSVMHSRLCTQTIPCISRTVIGQSGHSLLQDSMPDDEELDCVASKRKVLNWTPLAWLNSLSHHTGFSTSVDFNKEKVMQDWTAWNCQQLGLPIPHLKTFRLHACTCRRFAIDEFGDHLHCCTQHAGATTGAT